MILLWCYGSYRRHVYLPSSGLLLAPSSLRSSASAGVSAVTWRPASCCSCAARAGLLPSSRVDSCEAVRATWGGED